MMQEGPGSTSVQAFSVRSLHVLIVPAWVLCLPQSMDMKVGLTHDSDLSVVVNVADEHVCLAFGEGLTCPGCISTFHHKTDAQPRVQVGHWWKMDKWMEE